MKPLDEYEWQEYKRQEEESYETKCLDCGCIMDSENCGCEALLTDESKD